MEPLLRADEVIGVCRADVDLHLAHRPGEDACCRRVVVADRRTGIASQVDRFIRGEDQWHSRRELSLADRVAVDHPEVADGNLMDWAFSASFDKDGEEAPGAATGILSLYHGDHQVGEGRIKTQPGKFSVAGEGLCVGRDGGEPVTDDYPGSMPWEFSGGTIHRVAVDVSGDPYVDLEREAVAMMSRE